MPRDGSPPRPAFISPQPHLSFSPGHWHCIDSLGNRFPAPFAQRDREATNAESQPSPFRLPALLPTLNTVMPEQDKLRASRLLARNALEREVSFYTFGTIGTTSPSRRSTMMRPGSQKGSGPACRSGSTTSTSGSRPRPPPIGWTMKSLPSRSDSSGWQSAKSSTATPNSLQFYAETVVGVDVPVFGWILNWLVLPFVNSRTTA